MPEYSKSTAINTSAAPMSTSTTLSDVPSVCAACEVQSLDGLGPLCLSSLIVPLAYEFPGRPYKSRPTCLFRRLGRGRSIAQERSLLARLPVCALTHSRSADLSACS